MDASRAHSSFAERWATGASARSPLVLGVAPSSTWLRAWGLDDDVHGARKFCDRLLPVLGEVAAVKAQMPFFARFGGAGLDLAARLFDDCRSAGALTIADAKLCDSDDTMSAYADVYLGPSSILAADGVTVAPFMGVGSASTLCRVAAERGCAPLVLVRTSNHQAETQAARVADGRSVSEVVADQVEVLNSQLAAGRAGGPVAALVGAPPDEALELVRRMPSAVVSLPGLGRPGRSVADVVPLAAELGSRAMFPITSGVLSAGPAGIGAAVAGWKQQLGALRHAPVAHA